MSLQPSVTLVCLVADRDEMLERAIRCWRAQSYPCKLLVYDNGAHPYANENIPFPALLNVDYVVKYTSGATIGELRNAANALVQADIIAHLDSDDYSHSSRIEEQVALLQSSGADCVGYSDMLFWCTGKCVYHANGGKDEDESQPCRCAGEAWLYRSDMSDYALGTSLCYWRKSWERRPFAHTSQGEDLRFIEGLKVRAVSSVNVTDFGQQAHPDDCVCGLCGPGQRTVLWSKPGAPRMIATIHGGNTSNAYSEANFQKREWRRASEWDAHIRGVLEGK